LLYTTNPLLHRFGVALVDSGIVKLKSHECSKDKTVIEDDCDCQACRFGISKSRLNGWLKSNNTLAAQLITNHNLVYMKRLTNHMRKAIKENAYPDFCRRFLKKQFPDNDVPQWVRDALHAVDIEV